MAMGPTSKVGGGRLVVGGWQLAAVGGGWWLAVGGGWWLAVGGWRSLGAILRLPLTKKTGFFKDSPEPAPSNPSCQPVIPWTWEERNASSAQLNSAQLHLIIYDSHAQFKGPLKQITGGEHKRNRLQNAPKAFFGTGWHTSVQSSSPAGSLDTSLLNCTLFVCRTRYQNCLFRREDWHEMIRMTWAGEVRICKA